MLILKVSKKADKFLSSLPPKHRRQITKKINTLPLQPFQQDSKKLVGFGGFYRVDAGEYRVIYQVIQDVLDVFIIGKRNDDEVYRKFKRMI